MYHDLLSRDAAHDCHILRRLPTHYGTQYDAITESECSGFAIVVAPGVEKSIQRLYSQAGH